jgi:hypothetical protein
MIVAVPLPSGLASRIPTARASELLGPYCSGFGRPLPYDPGSGPDVIEIDIPDALISAMRSNYRGVSPDEVVRRVLAANVKPEPKPNPNPNLPRTTPAPSQAPPKNSKPLSPTLSLLFAMLAPVVGIVLLVVLLRRVPGLRTGGSFDEWTGGQ